MLRIRGRVPTNLPFRGLYVEFVVTVPQNPQRTSVNLQAKYLHEFAAKRRLESDSFWFTASLGF